MPGFQELIRRFDGLRFLLKTEELPYSYLHLPAIQKDYKLPVVLSKQEVWLMLKGGTLLKHKVLIGLTDVGFAVWRCVVYVWQIWMYSHPKPCYGVTDVVAKGIW